jgi:hypothetical protein
MTRQNEKRALVLGATPGVRNVSAFETWERDAGDQLIYLNMDMIARAFLGNNRQSKSMWASRRQAKMGVQYTVVLPVQA